MTSRSFIPASSLSSIRPRRPPLGSRSSSAASISSQLSQDYSLPTTPNPSATGYFSAAHDISRSGTPGSLLESPHRIGRSIPIAIELPPRKKSGAADTPPEPLSARGDLLGGYFPLHEENQRAYKPHPFDNRFPPRSRSPTPSDPDSPQYSPHGSLLAQTPPLTDSFRAFAMASMSPPTVSLGKYHPSTYKNKRETTNSSTSTPQDADRPQQKRQKSSDVRMKLQQYQREMVEQAAIAGKMSIPGARPVSPRLMPLGSPGPVTPMQLEESAGYMGALGDKVEQDLMGRIAKADIEMARTAKASE